MNLSKKLLCLFLALTTLISVLSACTTPPPEDGNPSEESDENTSSVIDLSGYTMIRPSDCDAELAKASSEFQMAINEATGTNLILKEDFLPDGAEINENDKEILVGLTNREESSQALEELGDQFSFAIQVKGNKVVIIGATAELTMKGIDFLFEQYLPRSTGDGTLTIPTSYVSHPQSYQEIVTDGIFNYELIYSKADEGTANFLAVNGLIDSINQFTKIPVSYSPMSVESNVEIDLTQKAIVVGATGYPRSAELLKENGFFGWALSVEGNQIYVSAYEFEALSAACNALKARMKSGTLWTNEKTVRICQDTVPTYGCLKAWEESIPDYESGTMQSLQEFTPDHFRLYYTMTTRVAYDSYVEKIEASGFSLYGSNELDSNIFRTYFKNDLMLHVYYMSNKNATSILMVPTDSIERYPNQSVASDPVVSEPSLMLMNMNYSAQETGDDGMGFVFTLADGSFVVIDGGYATEAQNLHNFMVANSPTGHPLIRAWILTHPDEDHYGCFTQFAKNYSENVTLEYFVAQFDQTMLLKELITAETQSIESAFAQFDGCKRIIPLTGQKMYFGSLEVDFLYTAEALHPLSVTSNDEHSLVLRARFEEQTVLFMGDIQTQALTWITSNYDTALKSDYVQAPDHGLRGNADLYNCALPSYLILCTNEATAQSRLQMTSNYLQPLLNQTDESGQPLLEQIYIADNSYAKLIPCDQSPADIPDFTGGTLTSIKEFTPGYYRFYYQNANKGAYDAYLQTLVNEGYALYGSNEIDGNAYNTYYRDNQMLHVYYLATEKTVSILTTTALDAVAYPKAPVSDVTVTAPTFALASLNYDANGDGEYNHNNGLGFVFTLADGSYVIVDGGYAADAEPLYQYLLENNKRTDGKILIRAWIITHPDVDHYACFLQFANKHATDVKLEYLVTQFDQDRINSGAIFSIVNKVYAAQKQFTDSKRIVPLLGQKMYFGDLEMEFLFTAESLHPKIKDSNNEHSLVMRVSFGGKTILLTADVVSTSLSLLTSRYTDALKCDFLQAPHHGLNGTSTFYNKTLPTYLILCTHLQAANERWNQGRYDNQSSLSRLKALDCVEYVYVADTGTPGFITLMSGTQVIVPDEPMI